MKSSLDEPLLVRLLGKLALLQPYDETTASLLSSDSTHESQGRTAQDLALGMSRAQRIFNPDRRLLIGCDKHLERGTFHSVLIVFGICGVARAAWSL